MITADMFILPDGSPMTPDEIALMVNDWKLKGPVVSTKQTLKLTRTGSELYGYNTRTPVTVTHDYDLYTSGPTVKTIDIPIYKENVYELLNNMINDRARDGENVSQLLLGYDLYYNYARNIGANLHQGYLSIYTAFGMLTIYPSPTLGLVEFILPDFPSVIRAIK